MLPSDFRLNPGTSCLSLRKSALSFRFFAIVYECRVSDCSMHAETRTKQEETVDGVRRFTAAKGRAVPALRATNRTSNYGDRGAFLWFSRRSSFAQIAPPAPA